MTGLTISALARAADVGVETVRYYQRRRLLGTPDRPDGAERIRRYGADDVRRLRFIRAAQTAGFTLDEIGELISLDVTEDRARARDLATARIAALSEKIAILERARRSLRRLAHDCGAGGDGPCPILTSFDQPVFDQPVGAVDGGD